MNLSEIIKQLVVADQAGYRPNILICVNEKGKVLIEVFGTGPEKVKALLKGCLEQFEIKN